MFVNSQLVWVRDSTEGHIQGQITEIGPAECTVEPIDTRRPRQTCSLNDIFPSCDDPQDREDNCELLFLNEATLLENLKNRYFKDKIYTYVANILIAMNPYREIKDLYSDAAIMLYNGRSLGELPPHVFAIADKAIRDMRALKISQSIIVSGESGSGKTESTKYLLKYLCHSLAAAGPIEQNILNANPILEAFGNAKTMRNSNSSRFGKFIEVHYDSKCQVIGGHISHFLLEKSRICTQYSHERNYHVFYMVCAGAPQQMKDKLYLSQPEDYRYLSGCSQHSTTDQRISSTSKSKHNNENDLLKDPIIDNFENFQQLDQALSHIGLSETMKWDIYTLIAGVLHLGNITFEENLEDFHGGCKVSKSSDHTLSITAKFLGVDSFKLRQALVSRVMHSKETAIMVPLKMHEASNSRDALAKALYSLLFDHIVGNINQNIPFKSSAHYIGVLDIAGYENFTVNSFEQFNINYSNEKLQKFFNDIILKDEQELYRREGLNVPEIPFNENQDIIELIEMKPKGIFTLLEEESKWPKPSSEHFTLEVHKAWKGHLRLSVPRTSKVHRSMRDGDGFLVRHYAGAVCYNTIQFIEKNNDALHTSLEALVQESTNPLTKTLFAITKHSNASKGRLNITSTGSKFKTQLGELMEKLKQNGTNFIRCIKPNNRMNDCEFEGSLALNQLNCSGITSVLELMEYGYPSRVPFSELYNMYTSFLPPELVKLEPKVFCEALLHSLELNHKDFNFGITKVFFRPGKFVEFDRIMKSDPENMRAIVANVKKWINRSRWIKLTIRAKCVLNLQTIVRGFLARKQHQPRYRGIINIKSVKHKLQRSTDIVNQLRENKDIIFKEAADIEHLIDASVRNIQNNARISPKEIDIIHSNILTKIDSYDNLLKIKVQEQRQAEEQDRLRKIQEASEAARCREEERKRRICDEEENPNTCRKREFKLVAKSPTRLFDDSNSEIPNKKSHSSFIQMPTAQEQLAENDRTRDVDTPEHPLNAKSIEGDFHADEKQSKMNDEGEFRGFEPVIAKAVEFNLVIIASIVIQKKMYKRDIFTLTEILGLLQIKRSNKHQWTKSLAELKLIIYKIYSQWAGISAFHQDLPSPPEPLLELIKKHNYLSKGLMRK